MPFTALTVAILAAVLQTLHGGRRTPRRHQILRNRHGLFFHGAYRRNWFHRRRAPRCRRRNVPGRHRGCHAFGHRGGRHISNTRHRRQGVVLVRNYGNHRRAGGDPKAGPSKDPPSSPVQRPPTPLPHRRCAIHDFGPCPPKPEPPTPVRLQTPTPPVEPVMRFGFPAMGPGAPRFYSFTNAASTSTAAPSTSTRADPLPTDGAPMDTDNEEDLEEIPRTASASPPPPLPSTQPPRRGARIRMGGRAGELGHHLAPRHGEPPPSPPPSPPDDHLNIFTDDAETGDNEEVVTMALQPRSPSSSSDFVVITSADLAGPSTAGPSTPPVAPSQYTLTGGRLLQRHAALADTPPRRPGHEPGAWFATARRELHLNGPIEDYDKPSSKEDQRRP